VTHYQPHQIH